VLDENNYLIGLGESPMAIDGKGSILIEIPDDFDSKNIMCYKWTDAELVLDEIKLANTIAAQTQGEYRERRIQKAAKRLQEVQIQFAVQTASNANDVIAIAPLLPEWAPKAYTIGDIIQYGDAPYKCVQAHDATGNPGWNPVSAKSLWANYHATNAENALPWAQPTGAHDAYHKGEYMEFADGNVYCCNANNTVHAPDVLPGAWERA